MHILLFILYGIVLSYLITRMAFFRNSQLKMPVLLTFFGLRVATGCMHNWIAWKYYPGHGDIWQFFRDSFITRRELQTSWHAFAADNSDWASMPHNVIECLHILLNIFSFDNLYINTLLFSFFTFAGSIALFRAVNRVLSNDLVSSLPVLLLPSTLFWTSCIHTEGIVYACLGFLLYTLYGSEADKPAIDHGSTRVHSGSREPGTYFAILVLVFGILFFRSALAISLIPALAFWIWGAYTRNRTSGIYNRMLLGLPVVLLLLTLPPVSTLLLHTISARQHEFLSLVGNSRLNLPELEPNIVSFLHVLPYGIMNGFFQPTPGAGGQIIYTFFSLELIVIWIIVVLGLINRTLPSSQNLDRQSYNRLNYKAFTTGCILLTFSGMLLVGCIVPFAGAIIRYRSIFLPFLLAPFLHLLKDRPTLVRVNSWLKHVIQTKQRA